jgi:hypothetical protein
MIPASEEGRARQAPLLHELQRAACTRTPEWQPDVAVVAQARDLVETTLAGLREPASARPYDVERAQGLRRLVLTFVTTATDDVAREVAGDDPSRTTGHQAVLAAVRAGRHARGLLDDSTTASG